MVIALTQSYYIIQKQLDNRISDVHTTTINSLEMMVDISIPTGSIQS